MIKIVDRYLLITIFKTTLMVLLALCALNVVFAFRGQYDDIGDGNYSALQAFAYVIMLIPQSMGVLLPIAALLGVILGIGGLASGNELTVLRAAGMRPARIAGSLLSAGLIIALLGTIVHDQAAPPLAERAYTMRSEARAGGATQDKGQVWLPNNGNFLYIQEVPSATTILGLREYIPDPVTGNLTTIASADRAEYRDGAWQLSNYRASTWQDNTIQTTQLANTTGLPGLKPTALDLFTLKTEAFSISELYQYSQYLEDNQTDASQYQLAFWQRLARPAAVLVMVLLPLPFMFGSMRSMGAGQRTVIGVAIGITYFVANEMLANTGLLFGFSPFVAAWAPTLAFALLAMLSIRWVR